jgi:dolichol-phosphate mannosyltransferase
MLSLVIPCFNEGDVLPLTYETLVAESASWFEPLEIVFVDDDSEDDTWSIIESLSKRDRRVCGVRLTRNFGHQAAIGAGLEQARGEAVVILDADLQDPPALIGEMLARWQEGADIVYAQRTRRRGEGLCKRLAGHFFYRLLDCCTDTPIPRDAGDFCLLDARVVRTLRRFREQRLFWRGLRAWTGFRHAVVHFERPGRVHGQSKYTLRKLLELGGNGLLSFSRLPLRLPLYAGAVALVSSLLLMLASLGHQLASSGAKPWLITPTSLALFFLGSVQLLSLGVVGEYLNRIYEEARGRPRWIVERTLGLASKDPLATTTPLVDELVSSV